MCKKSNDYELESSQEERFSRVYRIEKKINIGMSVIYTLMIIYILIIGAYQIHISIKYENNGIGINCFKHVFNIVYASGVMNVCGSTLWLIGAICMFGDEYGYFSLNPSFNLGVVLGLMICIFSTVVHFIVGIAAIGINLSIDRQCRDSLKTNAGDILTALNIECWQIVAYLLILICVLIWICLVDRIC